jgi:hypothetical protein
MPNYNLTTASNVFKTKYLRMSRDMFNSENVILAKIKRNDEFVGDQALISVPTSFGGGRGSGVLPRANVTTYQKMLVVAKKLYTIIEIDNEAIKASQTDEGAFVRLSKEPVKRGVQSFQANLSRMLFNTSLTASWNGCLGTFTGPATKDSSEDDYYRITVIAAAWKQANWEPKDYVNVGTNGAEFEVQAVTPASRYVYLKQRSGATYDLTTTSGTNYVYMQNSKDNDATGFQGVVQATTGTVFNVAIGYRWQGSYQVASAGVGITPDYLNDGVLTIKYNFGESPDMIISSFVQYRKLLNQLEDQKRYMLVESRNSGPKGKFSFQALEFMADTGPIPIIAERFVADDTVDFMNSDFVEFHARPDGGWVEDPTMGGSIFRMSPTTDSWQARYAVYGEFATMPTAHGYIAGLTTT